MGYILQEAVFSNENTNAPECLYYRNDKGIFNENSNKLRLLFNKDYPVKLTFDTFFGAFPIETWYKYTSLKEISLKIKAKGSFTLNLIILNGYEPPQKIESILLNSKEFQEIGIKVNLEDLPFIKGILYPEFIILDDSFELKYLRYETEQKPIRNTKLAIIMPTYKREKYVKRNISILKKELFSDLNYDVDLFVIDNGQTLNIESTKNIKIIKNPNYGGAGGFARGIIETIDRDYTHVLFSDDDTLYEPESIKRLYNFFKYANEDVVVGGGMLNLNTKHILNEHGAIVRFMNLKPLKNNLDMCLIEDIIRYISIETIDYFAWWFFTCSKNIFKKFGLPLPIFFRGDDQEFGIRIKNNVNFVSLLGVAVWHEEFYKKDMPLTDYYIVRNGLILSMIHEKKSIKLIIHILRILLLSLLTYRYERAKFIVKGIEDFLKGPEFIKNTKPDKYHLKLNKEQKNKLTDMSSKFLGYKFDQPTTNSKLKKLLIILTLNGHLLPSFFIKKGKEPYEEGYVIERLHSRRLAAIFRKETVLYYEPTTGNGIEYKHSKKKFFSYLFKGLFNTAKLFFKYEKLQKEYKKEFKHITSLDFWKKYLNLK